MSVYIKGMEMPRACQMCPLSHWNKLDQLTGCELVRKYVPETDEDFWNNDRPSWCPLIEVPPHGDLIDRDTLLQYKGDCYDSKGHLLYAVGTGHILLMPTIIPAEEGE